MVRCSLNNFNFLGKRTSLPMLRGSTFETNFLYKVISKLLLYLYHNLSNSDVVKYPTVGRSALKRTVSDIGLSAESVSKICFNLLCNHKIKKRKTLCRSAEIS